MVDGNGKPCSKMATHVYKRWTQVPCAQQRCPCVACRQSWARNQSAKLDKSFEKLPPTHFVVLKHDFRSPDELWLCLKRFRRSLKDKFDLEYYLSIEQEYPNPPHIHLLIRTDDPRFEKAIVRPLWVSACDSEDVVVYCETVRCMENAAKYLPKYWHHHIRPGRVSQHIPWLPGDEWAGKKLNQTSGGFLSCSWSELWEQVKHDWFPEGEEDLDDIEVFQAEVNSHLLTTNKMTETYSWEDFLSDFDQINGKPVQDAEFTHGQAVKCALLPGVPATVVGRYGAEYRLRFRLEADQKVTLPQSVQDRLFVPGGTPFFGEWRIDVKPHLLGSDNLSGHLVCNREEESSSSADKPPGMPVQGAIDADSGPELTVEEFFSGLLRGSSGRMGTC